MQHKKLSLFNIAALYVGSIMGAGFASGREAWQFFGVFGLQGYLGIAAAGLLFMAMGMMVAYIARAMRTDDMGKIVLFTENPRLSSAIGYFMAAILYTVIMSMSAAGGSFLQQQFGLHKAIGGGIITLLVIFTVLSICSCSSLLFPSFIISRIRLTSSGEKRIPCLFAFVIRASIMGASSRPVFPEVLDAAILISSSFAGSIPCI